MDTTFDVADTPDLVVSDLWDIDDLGVQLRQDLRWVERFIASGIDRHTAETIQAIALIQIDRWIETGHIAGARISRNHRRPALSGIGLRIWSQHRPESGTISASLLGDQEAWAKMIKYFAITTAAGLVYENDAVVDAAANRIWNTLAS